jgi:hypothetical protein
MDAELDKAAVLMASKRSSPESSTLVREWNAALPLLGMLQVSVWVYDPADECTGIWRAALDGWRHGNSVWPI